MIHPLTGSLAFTGVVLCFYQKFFSCSGSIQWQSSAVWVALDLQKAPSRSPPWQRKHQDLPLVLWRQNPKTALTVNLQRSIGQHSLEVTNPLCGRASVIASETEVTTFCVIQVPECIIIWVPHKWFQNIVFKPQLWRTISASSSSQYGKSRDLHEALKVYGQANNVIRDFQKLWLVPKLHFLSYNTKTNF